MQRLILLLVIALIVLTPTRAQADTVVLKNGEELDGIVSGATEGTITLDTAAGPLEIPKDRIVQVFIGNAYRNASRAERRRMLEERRDEADAMEKPDSLSESESARFEETEDAVGHRAIHVWVSVGTWAGEDLAQEYTDQVRSRSLSRLSAQSQLQNDPATRGSVELGFKMPLTPWLQGGARVQFFNSGARRSVLQTGYDPLTATGPSERLGLGKESFSLNQRFSYEIMLRTPIIGASDLEGWSLHGTLDLRYVEETASGRSYFFGYSTSGSYFNSQLHSYGMKAYVAVPGLALVYRRGPALLGISAGPYLTTGQVSADITELSAGSNYVPVVRNGRTKFQGAGVELCFNAEYRMNQRWALVLQSRNILVSLLPRADYYAAPASYQQVDSTALFSANAILGAHRFEKEKEKRLEFNAGIQYTL